MKNIRRSLLVGTLVVMMLFAAACKADITEGKEEPLGSYAETGVVPGETEQPGTEESVPEQEKKTAGTEPVATPLLTSGPTPTPEPTHAPAKNEGVQIPADYGVLRKEAVGTVEEITYKTKDYYGTGEEVVKPALVYLPYGYDTEKKYNVLYVMHGGGGDETEWEIRNLLSTTRLALDNLIYYGDIEPLIVVFPNGRTGEGYETRSSDHTAFKDFGTELRKDLIPYIEANYATYGEHSPDGYDLTAARDHRAMAGWSFGGMQTVNIGLCECLDIMSYFGAFSPGNTTYNAEEIAKCLEKFEAYDIHYIYSAAGNWDGCLTLAHNAFVNLPKLTDKVVNGENLMMQVVPGTHNPAVGHLGLYNFLQVLFR